MSKKNIQSRRWSFTLNNYTMEDVNALEQVIGTYASYVCFAKESGLQGTSHLQGYLEFEKKITLAGLKKIPCLLRAHLEVARGSASQNLKYCSKENAPFVAGSPMSQGQRMDLIEVKDIIDSGGSMLDVAQFNFDAYVKYNRAFSSYSSLLMEETPYQPPEVYCIWGAAGVGKSRFVHDNYVDIWVWPGKEWFDGYTGQQCVLFDDFDGSDFSYRLLLRITDRYAQRVPVKGSHVAWRPKYIFFTSNVDPSRWYPSSDYAPLERRWTEVTHMA